VLIKNYHVNVGGECGGRGCHEGVLNVVGREWKSGDETRWSLWEKR
jgi:hypothetical protein